jgi:hypothetical protein
LDAFGFLDAFAFAAGLAFFFVVLTDRALARRGAFFRAFFETVRLLAMHSSFTVLSFPA